MARRNKRLDRRVNDSNANRRLPVDNFLEFRPPSLDRRQLALFPYEDRRQWHPEGPMRPARSFSSPRHRLRLVPPVRRSRTRVRRSLFSGLFDRIGFDKPKKVLVCVRRRMRKEVLHAIKKTGFAGQRRPRFNFYSKISCRR